MVRNNLEDENTCITQKKGIPKKFYLNDLVSHTCKVQTYLLQFNLVKYDTHRKDEQFYIVKLLTNLIYYRLSTFYKITKPNVKGLYIISTLRKIHKSPLNI